MPSVSRVNPAIDGVDLIEKWCNSTEAIKRWAVVHKGVGPVPGRSGTFDYIWLVNEASGKCMDLRDGANYDGAPVQQWTCSPGNQNQLWALGASYISERELINVRTGRCLDLPGDVVYINRTVWTYRCMSTATYINAAQFWAAPWSSP